MLHSNAAQQHVFVVGDGSLFDDGIMQLLTYGTDLIVSRAIYSDDLAFLNIIKQDRPDAILVCDSGSLDTARILDSVSSDPIGMGLPVVIARLYNNMIEVYESPIFVAGKLSYKAQRITTRTKDDLLNTLRRKQNELRESI